MGLIARFVGSVALMCTIGLAAEAPSTPSTAPASRPVLDLKSVDALPVMTKTGQALRVAGHYTGEKQTAQVTLDGAAIGPIELTTGDFNVEFSIPAVAKETPGTVALASASDVLAKRDIVRKPVKELTIYITPHSHVDIGYTQLQPEIEAKQVNNLVTALAMIEKSKDNLPGSQYRWTVEAAWTIDEFIKRQPDKLPELEAALKAGTVELDGAFANMLTGLCRPEELIRAYAQGAEYGKRFGVPVKAAQISDVPGYTWGTITSLAAAGVKYWSIAPNYMDRIGTTMTAWQDKPFYWKSPDGEHKVLCWVPYTGYAWSHIIRTIGETPVVALSRHLEQIKYPFDITYIRWSGHGDNAVPDPGLIDSVKSWNENYVWPKLVISAVSVPFEKLEQAYGDKLPVVSGDWTPYWEDGAPSSALETAMNRATDERLVAGEMLWAMLQPPAAFPANDFRSAWRAAMLYSEHTWGAHCSISEPENPLTTGQWTYKRGYATGADESSRKLFDAALAGGSEVAGAVDVFNVTSWRRSQIVVAPKELSAAGDKVTDADGKPVPSQRLSGGELAFLAANVPAMGSRRFVISAGAATTAGGVKAADFALENEALRVHVDPASGNIDQLVRTSDGFDFVSPKSQGLNEYIYIEGNHFDQPKKASSPQVVIRDAGPLVASVVIESNAAGCKKLTREVRLTALADHVELIDLLDKTRIAVKSVKEGGKPQDPNSAKEAVHFAFPFNVPDGQIRMDIPWAVMQPEKDQTPGACKNWFTVQRWVDISNDKQGVTWSPIDAPLVQLGGITATLIGSQTNPDAWMKHVKPGTALYSWAMNNYWHTNYRAYQEGLTTFRYSIRPHGAYSAVEAQRFGMNQSQPLIVTAARDRTPIDAPKLRLVTRDVMITACKVADDGKGYVIRLFAGAGKDVKLPLAWIGTAPKAVYLSDSTEARGETIGSPVAIPAWGVVTLRVE